MTPEALADLHARAFAGQSRSWSAAEFRDLLDRDHVFVVGDTKAFAMGQAVAGEAELLTLATDPKVRRQGRGRACLRAFEDAAVSRGAERLFLEVAADNDAALALYLSEGFSDLARRVGYYTRSQGRPVDALVLEKRLT
ncbi:ribosomal-protein-alanine N-acetyltransferase [Roseovarius sp. THAF8]|uniref:GNAT family N-acetyltransferase n=1 Tax=Roseovarius sp. THAF8 TaxID=2587846 RepID=UPI001268A263|nr:GNAT family N-acetyltransferase [Roseovarius sp. THAF8]QFT98406.1 ribosomal-protein-alanine N-acetyltransferase [Roseovarius sp. THAF8]